MITKVKTDLGDDVVISDPSPLIKKDLAKTQEKPSAQPLTGTLMSDSNRPPILVDNNYQQEDPASAALPSSPSKTPAAGAAAAQFPTTP